MDTFKSSHDAVVITGIKGKDYPIVFVNRAFEKLTGYCKREVLGRDSRFLQGRDRKQEARIEMENKLAKRKPVRAIIRNYRKDGRSFWNELSISPIRDGRGRITNFLAIQKDITAIKEKEDALLRQAMVDELTDFYNRRGFNILAREQIRMAQRARQGFYLFLADVDGLKKINDTYGHTEGDIALRKAADAIRMSFRGSDICGRLSGDEFAVIAPGTEHVGEALKKRLTARFKVIRRRSRKPYSLSLSSGFTYFDGSARAALRTLISRADKELYRDKFRA